MGKSHRDNHKARKKRGAVAFAKKAKQRQKRKNIANRLLNPDPDIMKDERLFNSVIYGGAGLIDMF